MNNWDSFWLKISSKYLMSLVLALHHKIVFKIYKEFLDSLNLKNPKVIELGCGSGELTARTVRRYGGFATLIDKSKKALALASKRFKEYGIKARFLQKDLFKLNLNEKFDIVHSEGLIEHFVNDKQKKIIDAHKKCVKKNGFVFICVPRPVWYYKMAKWFLEKINKWPFSFEKAMSKNELKKVLEKYGLKVIKFAEYSRYSFALAKI